LRDWRGGLGWRFFCHNRGRLRGRGADSTPERFPA
jgi:hypothetical protein